MKCLILVILTLSLDVFAIPNEHNVSEGIKRGGRPTRFDLAELSQQGFKTIINLESNESAIAQEKRNAERLGFNYIISELNTNETPDDSQIQKVLEILRDPSQQPVFIHCYHGQDRTGMVIGIHRVLDENWSQSEAYKEMLNLGFHPRYIKLKNYFFAKTK